MPFRDRAFSQGRRFQNFAVENRQVHQLVAKDVADDRGKRLSAANVREAVVTGKAGRREPPIG
jgi:hypothetical protein